MDSRVVTIRDNAKQQEYVIALLQKIINRLPPVFLISRGFVKSWRGLFEFIQQNKDKISFFPVNFHSQDDLFLIYAALNSPNTFILSNDFFRDHIFRMDDSLFTRWINNRRIQISPNLNLPWIFLSEVKVNVNDDDYFFHVPFASANSLSYAKWYCVEKRGKKKKKV